MVIARNIAEYTALTASTTPSAPISASAPSTQNVTASPVEVRTMASVASWRPAAGHRASPASLALAQAIRGDIALVVVLVGGALGPGVRRREHVLQQRRQQPVLLVDQVGAVVVGHLVVVGHRQRPGRAGLDAQAAADATQIVDLVDPAVAFSRRKPLPRRCCRRPRRRSRRPGRPRRTARSRCISPGRRSTG